MSQQDDARLPQTIRSLAMRLICALVGEARRGLAMKHLPSGGALAYIEGPVEWRTKAVPKYLSAATNCCMAGVRAPDKRCMDG